MRSELIYTAGVYLSEGISITLTDSRKVSIGAWKDFQSRFITKDELNERAAKAEGIAIVCGKVSGGLEVIDVDCKYDISGTLFQNLLESLGSLADKLVIARTKSGGYHLYYRCSVNEGNLKLARRHATDKEKADNPHIKVLVLIETRGEGGYVVAPPTDGYSWVSGGIEHIATITKEERDFIFEQCRSFNEYLETPEHHKKTDAETSFGISPIDDYNQRGDLIKLLTDHGWTAVRTDQERTFLRRPGKDEGTSGDYWHKNKWFSVFTTSSQFEPMKAYSPAAVYCLLECNNDWTKCVQTLAAKGYGEGIGAFNKRKNISAFINKLTKDGNDDDQIQNILVREKGMDIKAAAKALSDSKVPIQPEGYFWSRNEKDKLRIDKMKLIDWLNERGFRLLAYDDKGNDMKLVRVDNYIIEESSTEKVKKELLKYVKPLDAEVATWIIDNYNLINASFVEFIERLEPDFLKDDVNTAYFPFRNGVAKVTKEDITLVPYGEIRNHIWKSSKIDFDLELDIKPFYEDGKLGWNPTVDFFPEFLFCVAGQNETRWASFVTTIGYLLHNFKDPTRPYSIILAEETDNDSKGGGTGKGLFTSAIGKLVKSEQIDGKNFKTDKSFAFQRVNLDTRIINLQDVKENFDFPSYYSIVTEGITVEKKGQAEFFIPYEKSPKIIITTNYMVSNDGVHSQRRQRVLAFSDFFGANLTPYEHFGHQFFSGWDNGSWKVFYTFMLIAVKEYLTNGIVTLPISDNMKLKAIKGKFGIEFKTWFSEFIHSDQSHEFTEFKDLYSHFLLQFEFNESDYSRKKFKKALQKGCEDLGLKLGEDRSGQMGRVRVKILTDLSDKNLVAVNRSNVTT